MKNLNQIGMGSSFDLLTEKYVKQLLIGNKLYKLEPYKPQESPQNKPTGHQNLKSVIKKVI